MNWYRLISIGGAFVFLLGSSCQNNNDGDYKTYLISHGSGPALEVGNVAVASLYRGLPAETTPISIHYFMTKEPQEESDEYPLMGQLLAGYHIGDSLLVEFPQTTDSDPVQAYLVIDSMLTSKDYRKYLESNARDRIKEQLEK